MITSISDLTDAIALDPQDIDKLEREWFDSLAVVYGSYGEQADELIRKMSLEVRNEGYLRVLERYKVLTHFMEALIATTDYVRRPF